MIKIIIWVLFIVFVSVVWYWMISILIEATKCVHIWRVQYSKDGNLWTCLKCGKKKFYKNKINTKFKKEVKK